MSSRWQVLNGHDPMKVEAFGGYVVAITCKCGKTYRNWVDWGEHGLAEDDLEDDFKGLFYDLCDDISSAISLTDQEELTDEVRSILNSYGHYV